MDVINKRRSVRQYKNQPIEQEKIEAMLKAAMQAPSARNQQPWQFLVIQDKDNLHKLSHISKNAQMVRQAGVAFVLLIDTQNLRIPEMAPVDLAAATENLLLKATDLGLGSVWIGVYGREGRPNLVKEVCSIPKHLEPFSIVSVGYPLDENANYFIDRFDKSKITYESF